MEKGVKLLSHQGIISYITPNPWLKNVAQSKIRLFMLDDIRLSIIVPKIANAFENASVDTAVFVGCKNSNNKQLKMLLLILLYLWDVRILITSS